jgi:CheY-like chemotaxis protein
MMAMQSSKHTPKNPNRPARFTSRRFWPDLKRYPLPLWPFLLGILLTPWLVPQSQAPASDAAPWLCALQNALDHTGLSVAWLGLWLTLAFTARWARFRHEFAENIAGSIQIAPHPPQVSAQQIAQLNQHWVTPLGHIRAAADALANLNESAAVNERITPELIVIRAANAQLRLTIENVLDYHELASARLEATPRKADIRLQIEDAVAEWQIPAQHRVGLIQYICFQDVPALVMVDIRLLRRLLDNLFAILLEQSGISDCALTLLVTEPSDEIRLVPSTSAPDPGHYLELIIDAKTAEPMNDLAQSIKYQTPRFSMLSGEPLFMSREITAKLIKALTQKLGAELTTGTTRPHRQGFRLTFPAPILEPAIAGQPWLKDKRCSVLTQSPTHAQAWRGHLLAFGTEIVFDPAQDNRINCLFIDEPQWLQLQTEQPAWFKGIIGRTRIIGLNPHISLRGRPLHNFDWAQITLPSFIRQRTLQTLLPRIAQQVPHSRQSKNLTLKPAHPPNLNQNLLSFIGRTALVIDDDRIYQAHLMNLLTQIGMTVHPAAEGKTGLNTAEQTDLDIILTDMHLPDILGTGIVRMLRKQARHKDTPIIAITANVQSQVHQSLLGAGADMVLTKPTSLGELINAISQFLQPIAPAPPQAVTGTCSPEPDRVLNALLCDELPIYYRGLSMPQDDLVALRHLAHKLRGAAACCQAKHIQTHAGALEDSLLGNTIDETHLAELKSVLLQAIKDTIKERNCQPH